MRNMLLLLLALSLMLSTLIGCQPAPKSSEIDNNTGNDSEFSESDQDMYGLQKLLHLCTSQAIDSEALSKENPVLKKEFVALVKDVRIENDKYLLTIDKIEPKHDVDPVPTDGLYRNEEVINEEYIVDLMRAEFNIAFIVDPHNLFRAITHEGFKEYVKTRGEGYPFYFYSVDGELVLLYEMMLP